MNLLIRHWWLLPHQQIKSIYSPYNPKISCLQYQQKYQLPSIGGNKLSVQVFDKISMLSPDDGFQDDINNFRPDIFSVYIQLT